MHGNLGASWRRPVRQVTIVGVDVASLPLGEKLTVIWLLLMASMPTGGNFGQDYPAMGCMVVPNASRRSRGWRPSAGIGRSPCGTRRQSL
jgi:hypothetical protein